MNGQFRLSYVLVLTPGIEIYNIFLESLARDVHAVGVRPEPGRGHVRDGAEDPGAEQGGQGQRRQAQEAAERPPRAGRGAGTRRRGRGPTAPGTRRAFWRRIVGHNYART